VEIRVFFSPPSPFFQRLTWVPLPTEIPALLYKEVFFFPSFFFPTGNGGIRFFFFLFFLTLASFTPFFPFFFLPFPAQAAHLTSSLPSLFFAGRPSFFSLPATLRFSRVGQAHFLLLFYMFFSRIPLSFFSSPQTRIRIIFIRGIFPPLPFFPFPGFRATFSFSPPPEWAGFLR